MRGSSGKQSAPTNCSHVRSHSAGRPIGGPPKTTASQASASARDRMRAEVPDVLVLPAFAVAWDTRGGWPVLVTMCHGSPEQPVADRSRGTRPSNAIAGPDSSPATRAGRHGRARPPAPFPHTLPRMVCSLRPPPSTRSERMYYCSDFRGNVVALLTADGKVAEQYRYSASGVPFGLPQGNVKSDGAVDAATTGTTDWTITDYIRTHAYEARADFDLDGDVDSADLAIVTANNGKVTGRGTLSVPATRNQSGRQGNEAWVATTELALIGSEAAWFVVVANSTVIPSLRANWIRPTPDCEYESQDSTCANLCALNTPRRGPGLPAGLTCCGGGRGSPGCGFVPRFAGRVAPSVGMIRATDRGFERSVCLGCLADSIDGRALPFQTYPCHIAHALGSPGGHSHGTSLRPVGSSPPCCRAVHHRALDHSQSVGRATSSATTGFW